MRAPLADPPASPRPPQPARPIEIAGLAASLRTASWSRALLRAAAAHAPADVSVRIWDGLEHVPPFNEDREDGPADAAVAGLRAAIDSAAALLIVTPEYNGSFPGVLKNALDWASRPYGESVLQRTPIALVSTSPLPSGGETALSDLRRILGRIHADIVSAELAVAAVHTRIEDGQCDSALASELGVVLARLVARARTGVAAA